MVTSAYHRLRVDIERDADETDRSAITSWMMAFSSRRRLTLQHPRIGTIQYEGLSFWGSPVRVYDQFVRFSIDDLVERHMRAAEDALERMPEEHFDQAIEEFAGLARSADMKLSDRAAKIKGRLMHAAERDAGRGATGRAAPRPIPVSEQTADSLRYRLRAKAAEVRLLRKPQPSQSNTITVEQNFGAIQQSSPGAIQTVTPSNSTRRET